MRSTWKPDPLTVLSALLIVAAFPPWNLWPFLWICLVPWLFALNRTVNVKQALVQSFWLSSLMSLGGFYWVGFVLTEFGGLPWPVSVLGLILFSFIGQPQFYVFALILKKWKTPFSRLFRGHPTPAMKSLELIILTVTAALTYTGLDWFLPKIFLDTLGHAFYSAQHLRQVADLGGASLLTFLVIFVNEAIFYTLNQALKNGRKFAFNANLFAAAALCVAFWSYGYFRLQSIQTIIKNTKNGIQVAAIQANIGDIEKLAAEKGLNSAAQQILDSYFELSHQTLLLKPSPQLIIWPETAYPTTFGKPHSESELHLETQVKDFVKEAHVPLLFGGYDTNGRSDFNSMFFLTPEHQLQAYHKNILLIFGEYIPGAESFEFLRNLFPQVGNFGRGIGPEVIDVPYTDSQAVTQKLRIAPVICYEVLFPNFVIESARQGSQVIFNITNDSWFGKWGEPQLHLALSTFRSIETRLPLLRSTNTGISAVVLPDGDIQNPTIVGDKTILNSFIPLPPSIPTVLKSWGDWFGPTSLFLSFIGFFWTRRREKFNSCAAELITPTPRKN